ncbi:hypothetical protein RCL_jg15832.t1 [Rhizophagus clarus]|uniref:Uncharacterized protein n=1 Tax=Rhizophagus clarus TaxID=94130 RepID=A0A8H3LC24_9GLOM|nr:hypothetical protein RCL_jg15832.t1 [Rhizophagus clarus]
MQNFMYSLGSLLWISATSSLCYLNVRGHFFLQLFGYGILIVDTRVKFDEFDSLFFGSLDAKFDKNDLSRTSNLWMCEFDDVFF